MDEVKTSEPMTRKVKFTPGLKLNAYAIISDALERGAYVGLRRHYKHRDDCPPEPDLDSMASAISEAQMTQLSDVVKWEE